MKWLKQKVKSIIKLDTKRQQKFYRQLIKKGDICFDIGANIGSKSKVFLSLNTTVIAFEPQSSCINELKKIQHPQFSYHQYGIGSKNEIKELQLANHIEVATFSSSFIDFFENDNLQWSTTEKATVKKLDTIIKEFGVPDFCKIDVEGYEHEILSHLTHTLPLIEFEFTGVSLEDTRAIILLLDKGNTTYNFNLHERPVFQLKEWIKANEMLAIFDKIPKDRIHGNIFVKNTPI